jgi:ATP-binding cassette subfamily C protein
MSWSFETGSVAILGVAVYVSIRLLSVAPAEIIILLLVFARLMPRLIASHRDYQGLLNELPAFGTVISLDRECRDAAEMLAPDELARMNHRVELRDISFAYIAGTKPVIDRINVSIEAGQVVAFVGVSGSGKSTLADILMGLLKPDSGLVLVDGVPIDASNLRPWREQIGYVSTDTVLFHETIRANLLWARPQATEDEFWKALRAAAADDLVRRLPDGLDTVVGDRGGLLSQGERQRLAIARALLREPSMLIFDEATNSLDNENEERVLASIDGLRGKVTLLLIAHRPSTIQRADVVYVIDRGVVIESGDWQTLFAKQNSRIRAIYERDNLVEAMRS